MRSRFHCWLMVMPAILWSIPLSAEEAGRPSVDDEARTLLAEVVQAHRGAEGLVLKGKSIQHYLQIEPGYAPQMMGDPGDGLPLSVAFERSGRLALLANDAELICDGEQITIRQPFSRRYATCEPPESLTLGGLIKSPARWPIVDSDQSPIRAVLVALATTDDPLATLFGPDAPAPTLEPDRKQDGRTLRVIRLRETLPRDDQKIPGVNFDRAEGFSLVVDAETKRLRAVDFSRDRVELPHSPGPFLVGQFSYIFRWDALEVSTGVPDPRWFEAEPPIDYTRVESVADLAPHDDFLLPDAGPLFAAPTAFPAPDGAGDFGPDQAGGFRFIDGPVVPDEPGRVAVTADSPLHLKAPEIRRLLNRADSRIDFFGNDWAGELADVDRVLEIDPSNWEAHNLRFVIFNKMEETDKANSEIDELLRLDPEDANARYLRAMKFSEIGEYDKAMADIDAAIARDDDDASYHGLRGSIHHKTKENEAAIADYSEAIRLEPDVAYYRERRSWAFADIGDDQKALTDMDFAIAKTPDQATFYGTRGLIRERLKDYEGAITDTTEAIQRDPDNADFYDGRSWTYSAMGDLDKALADIDSAIEKAPERANFYNRRGKIHYNQKNYEDAIADYSVAIRLEPEIAYHYFMRGLCHAQREHPEAAIADYSAAIKRDPTYTPARYDRALEFWRQFQDDSAEADIDEAIRFQPDNPSYLYLRGLIRNRLRDSDGAIEDLLKALELAEDPALFDMIERALRGLKEGKTPVLSSLFTQRPRSLRRCDPSRR